MLVIHGAADSARRFDGQLPILGRDFRAIAPDLRGMGRSARVETYLPSDWVADLLALLAHLGIANAHVYGISLGARVALRLAFDHPSAVRSLILDNPIIANDPSGDVHMRGGFDASKLPERRREALARYHGDDWEEVFTAYARLRTAAGFQEQLDLREASKRVPQPALIMRGDAASPVHPLPHAMELHENLASSWLWIRPDTSGSPFEDHTEEACQLIRSFVASVSG